MKVMFVMEENYEGVSYYDDILENKKVLSGGCVSSGCCIVPASRERKPYTIIPYTLYTVYGYSLTTSE